MNDEQFEKSCLLYLAIGKADTAVLNSALTYKKRRVGTKIFSIVAACAVLVTVLTTVFAVGLNVVRDSASNGETPTVENCFAATGMCDVVDISEINLFDGTEKIIWRNSEGYHVVGISTSSEFGVLAKSAGSGESVAEGEDTAYRVWLSNGRGEVISPCLALTPGNVGYGELFDYSPEYLPTDEFIKLSEYILGYGSEKGR